jgi:prephenate dehydrogenase
VSPGPSSVGVVGTGLIGTSVALAAKHSGRHVFLRDTDPEHLAASIALGAGVRWDEGVEPDLIVVAVPPAVTGSVVCDLIRTYVSATVMDVASTKFNVQVDIQSQGVDSTRFVPSHPMAGRELAGPAAARPDLFADRVWVICPGASKEHHQRAIDLVTDARGVVVEMTADTHDRAVATTSHAAQILSSALAARLMALSEEEVRISGQGLRDVTRLAASDPNLWMQILRGNAREVAVTLRAIGSDINAIAKELERLTDVPVDLQNGLSTLDDLLSRGRQGHARIPGRHGQGAERFATVAVQVADQPGALAHLFVAAGDLGINLEDVRIDHLWGRPSGLVELSVDPDAADKLSHGLVQRGFVLRT